MAWVGILRFPLYFALSFIQLTSGGFSLCCFATYYCHSPILHFPVFSFSLCTTYVYVCINVRMVVKQIGSQCGYSKYPCSFAPLRHLHCGFVHIYALGSFSSFWLCSGFERRPILFFLTSMLPCSCVQNTNIAVLNPPLVLSSYQYVFT